jgi:hypothetical protein
LEHVSNQLTQMNDADTVKGLLFSAIPGLHSRHIQQVQTLRRGQLAVLWPELVTSATSASQIEWIYGMEMPKAARKSSLLG